MSIYIGNDKAKKIFIGNQKVKSIYLGENKVYSSGAIVNFYNYDGTILYGSKEYDEGQTVTIENSELSIPTAENCNNIGLASTVNATSLTDVIADENKDVYVVYQSASQPSFYGWYTTTLDSGSGHSSVVNTNGENSFVASTTVWAWGNHWYYTLSSPVFFIPIPKTITLTMSFEGACPSYDRVTYTLYGKNASGEWVSVDSYTSGSMWTAQTYSFTLSTNSDYKEYYIGSSAFDGMNSSHSSNSDFKTTITQCEFT